MRSFAEQADPEREARDVATLDRVLAERARERAEMMTTHRATPARSAWLDQALEERLKRSVPHRKPRPRPATATRADTAKFRKSSTLNSGSVPPVTIAEAARAFGVGRDIVQRARTVTDRPPELIPAIEGGEITVPPAAALVAPLAASNTRKEQATFAPAAPAAPSLPAVSPIEAALALVRTPMRFDGSLASAGALLIRYVASHANGSDVLMALGAVAQATASHGAVDVVHRVLREGRASTLRLIGEFHRAVEQVAPHIPFATFALLDAPLYRFVEHAFASGVISWTIDRERPCLRR